MTLRSRLDSIYRETRANPSGALPAGVGSGDPVDGDLAQRLGGSRQEVDGCPILVVERAYPLEEDRRLDMDSLHQESLAILADDDRFLGAEPRQCLFLDTETTGLSGGTGTYVFLIGVGFYTTRSFEIRQYFLPGLAVERQLLKAVQHLVNGGSFKHLITFNGKAYDLNLLGTRFVMKRLENPFPGLPHLDLLYPCRLLWRNAFTDCSLQTLEYGLLDIERDGDIPSFLIPGIYLDFLRGGRSDPFPRIFQHNRQDLISLAGLTSLACRTLRDPGRTMSQDGVQAVARLLEKRGKLTESAQLLRLHRARLTHPSVRLQLAFLEKRLGRLDEALSLFGELTEADPWPRDIAFEEAAKILEHHKRDLAGASALVDRALRHSPHDPALKQRAHRLRCRLQGRRWY